MPLGDGANWDETVPTDATLAIQIDDYDRDLRVGVRSRMALEHEWPSSQSATTPSGKHKFVTLQNQSTRPTLAGTQVAAVYSKTVGAGLQELYFEDEAGNEVQITTAGGVVISATALPAGIVLQKVSTIDGVYASISATVPDDDTIFQTGEGTLLYSLAVTPKVATSTFFVHGFAAASAGANNVHFAGLFIGTTADAFGVQRRQTGAGALQGFDVHGKYLSTTGAAITFFFRAGPASADTIGINGTGGRLQGGAMASGIIVEEVKG